MYDQVYIQVNYEKEMTLFGVVTQGSHTNPKEWMTSYQVKYANESGQNFTTVMDSCNGCDNKIPRVSFVGIVYFKFTNLKFIDKFQ